MANKEAQARESTTSRDNVKKGKHNSKRISTSTSDSYNNRNSNGIGMMIALEIMQDSIVVFVTGRA